MDNAVLKYNGKIYRVQRQPFETEEQVIDRLWYIVKHENVESKFEEVVSNSLKWMYEKYYKVKY